MNNYKIKSFNNDAATALGIVAVAFTTSINETLPFFLLPQQFCGISYDRTAKEKTQKLIFNK